MINITYLGHASFKVESEGYSIILDPYKGVNGFKDIEGTYNEVISSHSHFDHAYTDKIIIVKKESPFTIESIDSYHDETKGSKRGPNSITVIKKDNIKIVHLGDLGHLLDKDTLNKLKDTTLLLIPIGGTYTIDSDTALKIIDDINPQYVVPMHYKDKDKGLEVLEDIESFINKSKSIKDKLKLVKGYNETLELK